MPTHLHFGGANSFLISLISNSRMTFVKCDEKGQILDIAFKTNGSIFLKVLLLLCKNSQFMITLLWQHSIFHE